MTKEQIEQDIAYYTETIANIEPELKSLKVKLEQAYKQLERLEAKDEN